jgi:hypothetical protein
MTIYVNYQNYNEKLSSNLDQVICVVKGDLDIITLKGEENIEVNNSSSNPNCSQFKILKRNRPRRLLILIRKFQQV